MKMHDAVNKIQNVHFLAFYVSGFETGISQSTCGAVVRVLTLQSNPRVAGSIRCSSSLSDETINQSSVSIIQLLVGC